MYPGRSVVEYARLPGTGAFFWLVFQWTFRGSFEGFVDRFKKEGERAAILAVASLVHSYSPGPGGELQKPIIIAFIPSDVIHPRSSIRLMV